MKTETAIVLVVLIIGGVAVYKLFANQNVTLANTPLGANIGTVNALAPVAQGLFSDITSLFGNSGDNNGYTYVPGT